MRVDTMASPNESDLSETDVLESPLSETLSPLESPSDVDVSSPPLTRNAVTTNNIPTTTANMTSSSTPLGSLNAARKPPQATMNRSGQGLPPDLAAKMRNMVVGRNAPVPSSPGRSFSSGSGPVQSPGPAPNRLPGGVPSGFLPPSARPVPHNFNSAPAVPAMGGPKKPSLAEKRGMALPGGLPGASQQTSQQAQAPTGGRKKPMMKLSDMGGGQPDSASGNQARESGEAKADNGGSLLDKYSDFIDAKTGSLMFKGKATLTNQGVNFESGKSFSISLDEVDTLDELGKGNYGTVYKVRHSRPRIRRPGQGLAGNKMLPGQQQSPVTANFPDRGESTGVVMAMKEIRLELDDAKFAAIIMELDILHRCVSPFIIDFYGAFFQEGAVYICMEWMDGGSIDKIYGDGIPEGVLRKIALSTTMGLKSLKDEHNIIHRDVKPTNILVNTKGQVKICDFGVSGNLVASIAKTNIGCQSYMAPERISSGGVAQAGANPGGGTYSVQSDIWSLGLTIIECALGAYPYPPETYDNIFSQLSAIVDGEPPDLPAEGFSEASHDFVRGCLAKIPNLRPTYAMLLQHAWFASLLKPPTITEEDEEAAEAGAEMPAAPAPGTLEGEATTEDKEVAAWVQNAIERKKAGLMSRAKKPALHAAPLDATTSPISEKAPA